MIKLTGVHGHEIYVERVESFATDNGFRMVNRDEFMVKETPEQILALIRREKRLEIATAMANGLLSYSLNDPSRGTWNNNCSPEGLAEHAFALADAMLAERAKGGD